MLHSKKQRKVPTKRNINNTLKPKPSKGSSIKASLRESEKSKCRLKAAWADIIKRYQNISTEETDEIDLVTEEIVVDRGILQKDTIRYVGTLNLYASKLQEDADDDDSIWQPDPKVCEDYADFNQRVSNNIKTSDKTNDIIDELLEASNENFDWETDSSEYNEFNENLRDIDDSFDEMSDTEELSEIRRKNDSSENESLKITNEQSNSVILNEMTDTEEASEICNSYSEEALKITNEQSNLVTLTEISSSQSTENLTLSNSKRRLRVYSFNTFDSGHESESEDTVSECSDSDKCPDSNNEKIHVQQNNWDHTQQVQQETLNHRQVAQQETLNYCRVTQQETINYYQVTQQEALNYYQMQSIDYPQRETLEFTQKIPPIALTPEQQRLWLEPSSEDYSQLLTWTERYIGGH
ncbi:hypothetical protein RclHR1_07040002 [Rhizophagus clarus]|uniref:Uncharacterized protein n=1 Tax=Rhizophagus clarus TaxID=94130 RepID=A0A2Z6SKF3_9GLOM|nr:hypothetical protein RclHR1_07040002 [Rhizophagus clarus]GES79616.1 hypothetical protein GLOIN_2v1595095 [Rhizophagus clarus]